MPKKVFPWEKLKEIGDSFIIEAPANQTKKTMQNRQNSCRYSGMQQGKRLKFYPRPNGDCEVVFTEFVQEWFDKYKKNAVQ